MWQVINQSHLSQSQCQSVYRSPSRLLTMLCQQQQQQQQQQEEEEEEE